MGREIRKVPPNWDHPKTRPFIDGYNYQPMHDRRFEDAVSEWTAEYAKWEAGERPDYYDASKYPDGLEYWEWAGAPPDREYYRPWKDEDATWLQVWETVSEGTPVTPPFATPEELVDYLATNGDYWDQKRGDGPWDRAAAERFVKRGWAPSLIVASGGVFAPCDGEPTS